MKYVVCPPCGTVFEGKSDDEVVQITKAHAKEKHGYEIPRDEVLQAVTSTPPTQEAKPLH